MKFAHNGYIFDWRFVLPSGGTAGESLLSGKAELVRVGNRIYLHVHGDREYKVYADLAKGIKPEYWRQ